MTIKTKSGYEIENMILLESKFVRADHVVDDKTNVNNLNIDSDYNIKGKVLYSVLTVKFQSLNKETLQIDSLFRMAGVFKIIGKSELKPDEFGETNAPAIIFPFIREILSSTSVKAGLRPINLPPFNFSNFGKRSKR